MAFGPGTRIGVYEITAPLGSGGMGVVYQARDTRLDRTVALKFLPPELTRHAGAKERFLREARVASSLDHPNVCTIYEVGEVPDGDVGHADDAQLFIAMAHYDGETLKQRIDRGPFDVAEAIDIATQVARGLGKAHDAGIVHRDIKPANLIVTTDGLVKILDFGAAKLVNDVGLTQTGTTLGTVAYMSPEQAAGAEVDGRSDLWALGVVLYEMLAGRTPFGGEGPQAVIHNLLNNEPAPLREARPDLPAPLDAVVRRALSKDASQRYQQAAECVTALQAVQRELESAVTEARPAAGDATPSIAVLPFANMSPDPDQEYFCDGLAEELIDALARLEGLKVVARTSTFKFKGQADDIRLIGEQLGVETVLEGSVRKAGNRLRINAQLINIADGYHLWSARYDRTMDDVFAVQEEIAQAIVEKLKIELVGEPDAPLVKVSTTNLEAYNLLLEGRHHRMRFTMRGFGRALECFEQALTIDADYAMAHAGIGWVHGIRSVLGHVAPREAFPKVLEASERALSIDLECGEARSVLAGFRHWYDWDWAGAEREYRLAIELSPSSADAHAEYGHFLGSRGRPDEAIAEARRGVELDPLSLPSNRILALTLLRAGRLDEAADQCRKTLDLEPRYFPARWHLAQALSATGRDEEAVSVLEAGREDAGGEPLTETNLGMHYAAVGRAQEARAILGVLKRRREEGYLSAACIAWVHMGLDEVDEAMEWFEQAYRDRDGLCTSLAWLHAVLPARYQGFLSDPRHLDLLRRIEEGGKE